MYIYDVEKRCFFNILNETGFFVFPPLRHLWPEARSRLQISAQKGAREARAGQRAEQRETTNREDRFEDDNWNLSTYSYSFWMCQDVKLKLCVFKCWIWAAGGAPWTG